jgi:hypothetical protein
LKTLSAQRCYNHAQREAAARCTECQRFFCRECVSEHDHRVICSSCLEKLARPARKAGGRLAVARDLFLFLAAFFLMWIVFFTCGKALLALPSSFHEGAVWETFER